MEVARMSAGGGDGNHPGRVGGADQKTVQLECTYLIAHGSSYVSRTEQSFLWTVLPNPIDPAISQHFFELVSRKGTMVTTNGMINYVKDTQNFQLGYVAKMIQSGKLGHSLKPTDDFAGHVEMIRKDVLGVHGFIALTNRVDESLVPLKIILGVTLKDVVVLSSHVLGRLDSLKLAVEH
jgi:hypothetical protein